jgi:hypothetical protein
MNIGDIRDFHAVMGGGAHECSSRHHQDAGANLSGETRCPAVLRRGGRQSVSGLCLDVFDSPLVDLREALGQTFELVPYPNPPGQAV